MQQPKEPKTGSTSHKLDSLPRSVIFMQHETDCSDSEEIEEFHIEEKSEQSEHGIYKLKSRSVERQESKEPQKSEQ